MSPSFFAAEYELSPNDRYYARYNDTSFSTRWYVNNIYMTGIEEDTYFFKLSDPTQIWNSYTNKWEYSDYLKGIPTFPATNDVDGWTKVKYTDERSPSFWGLHPGVGNFKRASYQTASAKDVEIKLSQDYDWSISSESKTQFTAPGGAGAKFSSSYSHESSYASGTTFGFHLKDLEFNRNYRGETFFFFPKSESKEAAPWISVKMKEHGYKPWAIAYSASYSDHIQPDTM